MKIKHNPISLILALAMIFSLVLTWNVRNVKASSMAAGYYFSWIDAGGGNADKGTLDFYFSARIKGDYGIKVYRDGNQIFTENYPSSTITPGVRQDGQLFSVGYPLNKYSDGADAPTYPDRVRVDVYASNQLVYSTTLNNLLLRGHIYFPPSPNPCPNPRPCPNPNPRPCPTNHAPVVDSFTPDKTSVNPGEQVDIKALFHDADGDAMKLYFTGANSDNFVYSNTAGVNTPNYEYRTDDVITAPTEPGTYTYKVKANDGRVDSNVCSATITVNAPTPTNHAPVVDSYTPNKSVVNPGEQVDLKAIFHDADGDAMNVYFTGANNSNFVYNNRAGANTPNYRYTTDDIVTAPTAPGTYTYQVKVNDGKVDSNIGSATITVNAPVNHPPVVDSYTANKTAVNPGEQVDLKTTFHDPDGDAMSLYFTGANNDNFVYNSSTGASTPNNEFTKDNMITAPTVAGTYVYKVKANDGKVDSNIGSVTITVNSPAPTNHPPVIDSYTANKTTVDPGEQVDLKAVFHDPDGDAMNLYFTGANNDNFVYHNTAAANTPNYKYTTDNIITAPAATGTYVYKVKANDGKSDSNIGSVTITVGSPTPKEYLNWVDLGGTNGHMFFYFMADRVGAYSLDVFRDGSLIQRQNINATTTDGITRLPAFDPGFTLPVYPNHTLAPDASPRMKFNFYVTVDGKKYLLISENEQRCYK